MNQVKDNAVLLFNQLFGLFEISVLIIKCWLILISSHLLVIQVRNIFLVIAEGWRWHLSVLKISTFILCKTVETVTLMYLLRKIGDLNRPS